jgi:hypothetical protein
LILTIFGYYYFSQKYLYFSEKKFVYPETDIIDKLKLISGLNRTWSYGNAYIDKNIPMYFNLYTTDGYNGMYPRRYGELLSAVEYENINLNKIFRSDADIKPASEKESFSSNKLRPKIMSLLSVRYILETKHGEDKDHKTTEDRFPDRLFSKVFDDDNWRIWEYKFALPRVYMVPKATLLNNPNEILSKIYNDKFDPLQEVIIEEKQILANQKILCPKSNYSSTISDYSSNNVVIHTQSNCAGFLVLNDNYFPGWKVYIDRHETKLFRANYTFRTIYVPEGKHIIEFLYKPDSFRNGMIISIAGIILLVVFIIYCHKHNI